MDFFFYQSDIHVLLTKQFYKINCEIIKIKINREKAYNKTMESVDVTDVTDVTDGNSLPQDKVFVFCWVFFDQVSL